MPHEETVGRSACRAAANRNDVPRASATKFVAVAAAMALLAGCAVTVRVRDIAPSGYILTDTPNGDLTCTDPDPECFDGSADDGVAYRHMPAAGRGKINPHDDTETNFIFKSEGAAIRQGRPLR